MKEGRRADALYESPSHVEKDEDRNLDVASNEVDSVPRCERTPSLNEDNYRCSDYDDRGGESSSGIGILQVANRSSLLLPSRSEPPRSNADTKPRNLI